MSKLSKQVKWAQDVLALKVVTFVVSGAATVAAEPITFPMPEDGHYVGTTVTANTAPTDADLIVDVNKGGTTLYTTQASRPTIAATEQVSTEAAAPDVTSLAAGDLITFDVDQIGSTVAGSDLVYQFKYLAKSA